MPRYSNKVFEGIKKKNQLKVAFKQINKDQLHNSIRLLVILISDQ